jgi:tRNA G18 (ribose-2'-O)-methylase SpoU
MKIKDKISPIYVLLHDIRSTHNVGSIFRTSDAIGVEKVYISGYTPTPVDRFNRPRKDIAKVALGGEKSIPWEYITNPLTFIKKCKKEGMEIVVLEQGVRSVDYKKFKQKGPILFIVGNEVDGVEGHLLDLADTIVEISINGDKESLNVSVAFGVALYRISNI